MIPYRKSILCWARAAIVAVAMTALGTGVALARDECGAFPGIAPTSFFKTAAITKSIQTGEITIASGSASNTGAINSVTAANAVVLWNGERGGSATAFDSSKQLVSLVLTNGTTVTATTAVSDASNSRVVSFTVIEFVPSALNSTNGIQTGSITINGTAVPTNATATISSVNTARSVVIHQGQTFAANDNLISHVYAYLVLTNATTVTGSVSNGTGSQNCIVNFAVIQFAAGIVNSVQAALTKIAINQTSGTTTITAVTLANTWLIFNGFDVPASFTGTTADTTRYPYAYLSATTTITATRGAASAVLDSGIQLTVLEFLPGIIKSKQTGQTAIAGSSASQSNAITAVDATRTIANLIGWTTSANVGTDPTNTFATLKLASATGVQQDRTGTGTNTITQSWEALEFAA